MDTQKNGVLSKLNTWYVFFLGGWGSIKAAGERKNFCDNNMNLISRKQKTRINTVWHCVQNKPGGLLRGTLECGPPYFFGISESKPAFSNGSACSRNQPAPLIIPNFAWNIFSGLRLLSCKPLQGWQKKTKAQRHNHLLLRVSLLTSSCSLSKSIRSHTSHSQFQSFHAKSMTHSQAPATAWPDSWIATVRLSSALLGTQEAFVGSRRTHKCTHVYICTTLARHLLNKYLRACGTIPTSSVTRVPLDPIRHMRLLFLGAWSHMRNRRIVDYESS